MVSPLRGRTLPTGWRFALIGAVASLPVAAVVNWLPNSEATIGGGIMIVGAFIAGVIAAIRSTDPDAAGLRAGFLGGVVAVFTFILTVISTAVSGTMAAWPLSRVVFFVFASGLILCIAPYSVWDAVVLVVGWQTPSPHDGRPARTRHNNPTTDCWTYFLYWPKLGSKLDIPHCGF